jgi:1,4-dihydroxy-2-naphthoate octaprenyltransferase
MRTFLVYMIRIRRVEFRVAEIPIFAIPILLLLPNAAPLRTFGFWEGLFLFFLLFAFGDVVNCLADRDLDATYKKHLHEAVYGLGVRFVTVQAWAMAALALAVAVHLGWQLHRWLLVPLVATGLVLGYAYSVPPVRLKSRGGWNFACVWAVVFVGPMLLASFLVADVPSWLVIVTAAAFGFIQEGIIQVNSAEDYVEDRELGVRTLAVSIGLPRAITVTLAAIAAGGGALLATVAWSLATRRVPPVGWLAIVPVAAICAGAAVWVARLRRGIARMGLDESVARVKRAGRLVPLWLTLVAWATLTSAAVSFLAGRPA